MSSKQEQRRWGVCGGWTYPGSWLRVMEAEKAGSGEYVVMTQMCRGIWAGEEVQELSQVRDRDARINGCVENCSEGADEGQTNLKDRGM